MCWRLANSSKTRRMGRSGTSEPVSAFPSALPATKDKIKIICMYLYLPPLLLFPSHFFILLFCCRYFALLLTHSCIFMVIFWTSACTLFPSHLPI